ncbi:DUF6232 family protein [Kamptonema sp. UHCC 0994]|uniref:DUF6232 family protein n=1 Tax=Kamptonema sp. UHCC 0994 TaxID=3031329 RepID=UPI0023B89222|nr:DUF6232 family protein [Kamptonema sp. UHCC 0994]MDF0554999.1 DUF6232 family protein [Kamptonema sp. UHCC 0994]
MAENNILPQDTDKQIRNTTIEITKQTVRFGSEVYQFRNVTGFGVSSIKTENVFPIQVILGLFVIGLFLANIPNWRIWGIILVLVAIDGFYANTSQAKKYGLKLYLNSGYPSPVFISSDMRGLEKVVSILYKFMESNTEVNCVIHIEDRSIRIEGSVGGSVTAGNIGGSSSSQVGGNVSRNE